MREIDGPGNAILRIGHVRQPAGVIDMLYAKRCEVSRKAMNGTVERSSYGPLQSSRVIRHVGYQMPSKLVVAAGLIKMIIP